MSGDAPISRKEKKAQRDAQRHQPGRKRKRAEAQLDEHDGAGEEEMQADFIPLNGDGGHEEGQNAATEQKAAKGSGAATATPNDESEPTAPKSKKRKSKHTTTQAGASGENGATIEKKPSKPRFILFIGNLPYAATDAALREHFKKIEPFTLRHRTDPKTKKSKGFAFLEFEDYDRMKTCLKLYHHTMFIPGGAAAVVGEEGRQDTQGQKQKEKEKAGRRINVELTAGGGGRAEPRKEKIRAKNVRLDEQRKRRAEAEKKEREAEVEKQQKKAAAEAGAGGGKAGGGTKDQNDAAGIHPSRLARVKR